MLVVSNAVADGKRLAKKLNGNFFSPRETVFPDSEKIFPVGGRGVTVADVLLFKFNTVESFDDQLFNLLCWLRRFADRRVTRLVLPYLPYLRSYPFSRRDVDKLAVIFLAIAERVKKLYLVSPHVSVTRLAVSLPLHRFTVINIDRQIIAFLASLGQDLLLVAPDAGSAPTVRQLATAGGWDYAVISKRRISPVAVVMHLDKQNKKIVSANAAKRFVIIDDMVSTGATLAKAGALLRSCGANKITCLVTHDTSRGSRRRKVEVRCSDSLLGAPAASFDLTGCIAATIMADRSARRN
ncbi:MAG: phosphoribosyltransferase family protein [Patescibacteria group bacterium]|nr:phosphoribosyltransferase family protein [Patescibacteria group bacterium]